MSGKLFLRESKFYMTLVDILLITLLCIKFECKTNFMQYSYIMAWFWTWDIMKLV